MHRVRLAVHENKLTSSAIGPESYVPAIETTGRGWVIEQDGVVVTFAIGNAETGNIWALFVDPEYESRGLGRRLHDTMVAWLFSRGLRKLWLNTSPNTRAERFYNAAGWQFKGVCPDGQALYELDSPHARSPSAPTDGMRGPSKPRRQFPVSIVLRRGEFAPGYPFAYVADPDGYEIEIWYEQPAIGPLVS